VGCDSGHKQFNVNFGIKRAGCQFTCRFRLPTARCLPHISCFLSDCHSQAGLGLLPLFAKAATRTQSRKRGQWERLN